MYENLIRIVTAIGGPPKAELDRLLLQARSSEEAQSLVGRMRSLLGVNTTAQPVAPTLTPPKDGRRKGRRWTEAEKRAQSRRAKARWKAKKGKKKK